MLALKVTSSARVFPNDKVQDVPFSFSKRGSNLRKKNKQMVYLDER